MKVIIIIITSTAASVQNLLIGIFRITKYTEKELAVKYVDSSLRTEIRPGNIKIKIMKELKQGF